MKQILSPYFFQFESEFLHLRKVFNCITIHKRKQIQDNLKIKIRDWRTKNQLEELKEEYLQAIVLRRSCEIMSNICNILWLKTSNSEGEIDWKRVSEDLGYRLHSNRSGNEK